MSHVYVGAAIVANCHREVNRQLQIGASWLDKRPVNGFDVGAVWIDGEAELCITIRFPHFNFQMLQWSSRAISQCAIFALLFLKRYWTNQPQKTSVDQVAIDAKYSNCENFNLAA